MTAALPIRQIFEESINLVDSEKGPLIRLCWPYIVLSIVAVVFEEEIQGDVEQTFFTLTLAAAAVLALVSCHRIFLLPDDRKELEAVRFSRRDVEFFLVATSLLLITMAVIAPFFFVLFFFPIAENLFFESAPELNELLMNFLFLPGYFIIARLSLVLPAIAVDNQWTFRKAWYSSNGNGMRLTTLIVLAPLVSTALITSAAALVVSENIFLNLFFEVIYIIVGVFEVCLLSLSYAWLESNINEQQ